MQQFDLGSTTGTLMESNGFDRRAISDGPVTQLQWMAGMNFISAITFSSMQRHLRVQYVANNYCAMDENY